MIRAILDVSSQKSSGSHQRTSRTTAAAKKQPRSPSPERVSRGVSPLLATKRKLVTFNNAVRVIKSLHINSYSHVEIDACWYSQQEYRSIRESAGREAYFPEHDKEEERTRVLAQHLQNRRNDSYHKEEYGEPCVRGIECFTPRGARRRLRNKISGLNAVLFEQGLQWDEDVCRPDDIAKVYKLAASKARIDAIRAARKDEVHARVLIWCSR